MSRAIIAVTMAGERTASVVTAGGTRHQIHEERLQVTSVFTKRGEHGVVDHEVDKDEEILTALGYKQEFKRWVVVLELCDMRTLDR